MEKMNARKKAARAARLRKQRTRRALLTLCLMLAVAVVSIGGTIAWLTDKTDTITNKFTASDVDIELKETTGTEYKMVPGATITKDPKVTVKDDSEACWVFVKIEKSTDKAFDDYMTYNMATGWTDLTGVSGVYYREVNDTNADQVFEVIANDTITVKDSVTKAMMDALTDANTPKLTITAYAIQKTGFDTASAAWAEVSKGSN